MLIDLTDTTTGHIRSALTKARDQLGGPTTGVVLNLIIVTDEALQHDAVRAASQAGREHPCRVLAIIARDARGESRLDAEIRTGEGAPGQTVVLRLYGPMSLHADSVVAPLLVPDTPVVTWWPGAAPSAPAATPLGALAQRRITDSAAAAEPGTVLTALAASYRPGDTDLAWTRATSWRSLLAATLDQPHERVSGGHIAAEQHNPSADLIAAWLAGRLGVPVSRDDSGGPGITEVAFATGEGDIRISRPDGRTATLSRPGQPDRHVALHRRESAELLAEELRRLDPDEIYAEALAWVAAGAGRRGARRGRPGQGRSGQGRSGQGRSGGEAAPSTPRRSLSTRTPRYWPGQSPGSWSPRWWTRSPPAATPRSCSPAAESAPESWPSWPRDRAGMRWTGGGWTSGGVMSGSGRPATPSGTRPAPGRRCSITSTSAPIAFIPCPAPTARTAMIPRRPRSGMRAGCAPPPGPRITARSPRSTCCCSASGPRGMSPRCSPACPPCMRTGRWWPSAARPSRRPPG